MSIRLMTQLWDNADPELSGSRLVIMLCLADHANDDGECWPSITRIAIRSRLHRQNVMVHLKELEALGYITVKRIEGRHNSYVLHTTRNETVTGNETVTSNATVTTTSNATVTGPVTLPLPEPLVNHQSKRQVKQQEKKPTKPLPPYEMASAGRGLERGLLEANSRLSAELRQPLYDALLDVTGTRALSDLPTALGNKAHLDAVNAACDIWTIGYKTDAEVNALEALWYSKDFRGLKEQRPTLDQFLRFASDNKAGKRNNGNVPPADLADANEAAYTDDPQMVAWRQREK